VTLNAIGRHCVRQSSPCGLINLFKLLEKLAPGWRRLPQPITNQSHSQIGIQVQERGSSRPTKTRLMLKSFEASKTILERPCGASQRGATISDASPLRKGTAKFFLIGTIASLTLHNGPATQRLACVCSTLRARFRNTASRCNKRSHAQEGQCQGHVV